MFVKRRQIRGGGDITHLTLADPTEGFGSAAAIHAYAYMYIKLQVFLWWSHFCEISAKEFEGEYFGKIYAGSYFLLFVFCH